MAKDKKGFVLYADLWHTFEHLNNEQRGEVITWILMYVNDLNPLPLPGLLAAVVEPIKQQLKRDLKKYVTRAENSKKNGKLGGRPKNPKKPTGLINNPSEPKEPDKVTVTVKDTVTVKEMFLNREHLENQLNNSVRWLESVLKNMRALKLDTNIKNTKNHLYLFLNKLEAEEDLDKPLRNIKSHFTRWYKIELEKTSKTTTKQTRHESNLNHNQDTANELGLG